MTKSIRIYRRKPLPPLSSVNGIPVCDSFARYLTYLPLDELKSVPDSTENSFYAINLLHSMFNL